MRGLLDTPPRRHRLRFGMRLRTLMLTVLVVGGGFGWVGYRARLERDAAEAITRAGGRVYYDWQWFHGRLEQNAQPGWLTRHLGRGYFEHIVSIGGPYSDNVGGLHFDDAVLAHIGRLGRVEWITTYPSNVTDLGMAHLRGLTDLRRLQIASGRVTGASLANLSGMTRLEYLRLYTMPIADADLVHLAGLSRLNDLCLDSPRITDAGLVHLAGLTKLQKLSLTNAQITDASLVHLQGMNQLKSLNLSHSHVSDKGIAALRASLPNLLHVIHDP